jgi:hypothetical protein
MISARDQSSVKRQDDIQKTGFSFKKLSHSKQNDRKQVDFVSKIKPRPRAVILQSALISK